MSRAFVKEPDGDAVRDDTPELPISPHPNKVTPRGLALLRTEQAALQAKRLALRQASDAMAAATELAQTERRLRYVDRRLASAILIEPSATGPDRVRFGCTVGVATADEESDYTIVGEDEAEPEKGRISHVSPLAVALMDAEIGDVVRWQRPRGPLELEILEIGWGAGSE